MIHLEHVALEFGDRVLFDDVTLSLSPKYRYVVVGANGAGKSSLLTLLSRLAEPTLGEITVAKTAKMGWMKQDHHLYDTLSILDVVIKGREPLWQALEEKHCLLEQSTFGQEESDRLSKLEERIEKLDGYRAEADAASLLIGLGIEPEKHQHPLKSLSGGWKMRVLLAQLLFVQPDILLLDEPTNYLDIVSISWLEAYLLNSYKGLLIVVSHDERFLESIGTCVLDVDYGGIMAYPGTYQNFLKKKDEVAEQKSKEYALVEAQVKRMQRFVERFKNKPSKSKQATSRQKMIDRVKWPELGRSSRESPFFSFTYEKRSGQIPIKIKGLCKIFEPDIFIGPLDLEVHRGERIAFIGANGSGKTTLMKMITGDLEPDEGSVKWGHQASFAVFEQEHKHLFTGSDTVLQWLEENVPDLTDEKRRQILGSLLFRSDDTRKKISMLSGGEMARLLIAKIMLKRANVLILDEPTNHLDLESKEALAQALRAFEGTVLFVSHDRHFIDLVATKKMEINRDIIKII